MLENYYKNKLSKIETQNIVEDAKIYIEIDGMEELEMDLNDRSVGALCRWMEDNFISNKNYKLKHEKISVGYIYTGVKNGLYINIGSNGAEIRFDNSLEDIDIDNQGILTNMETERIENLKETFVRICKWYHALRSGANILLEKAEESLYPNKTNRGDKIEVHIINEIEDGVGEIGIVLIDKNGKDSYDMDLCINMKTAEVTSGGFAQRDKGKDLNDRYELESIEYDKLKKLGKEFVHILNWYLVVIEEGTKLIQETEKELYKEKIK